LTAQAEDHGGDENGRITASAATAVSPARLKAAAALRRLGHAIVSHEIDDEAFDRMTSTVEALVGPVEASPPRRRATPDLRGDLFAVPPPQGGVLGNRFADCIVTGAANPMGVAARMQRQGDEAVLHSTLGEAFEGAPGRAHGGVVACRSPVPPPSPAVSR
jgi:hypothetical protein